MSADGERALQAQMTDALGLDASVALGAAARSRSGQVALVTSDLTDLTDLTDLPTPDAGGASVCLVAV